MSDPNFTPDDVLLAADRFEIEPWQHGSRLYLADDWLEVGKHLSTVDDCVRYARASLERGFKVNIKPRHEHYRVPQASS